MPLLLVPQYVALYEHLEKNLSPKRLGHVYGVCQTAVALARIHNVDQNAALQAALLHDSAKYLSDSEMESELKAYRRAPAGEDKDYPQTWHGTVAALWGPGKFGIEDALVIHAAEHHTLGVADPSPLLMVLMAADATEPTRSYDEVDYFRHLVRNDLKKGLRAVLEWKINSMKNERKVHSRVFIMIESLDT